MIAIDILRPVCKPSDGLIVNDLLPLAWHIRFRDGNTFTDVQCDVFRAHAVLVEGILSIRLPK